MERPEKSAHGVLDRSNYWELHRSASGMFRVVAGERTCVIPTKTDISNPTNMCVSGGAAQFRTLLEPGPLCCEGNFYLPPGLS